MKLLPILKSVLSLPLILFILISQASQALGETYAVGEHQIEVTLTPDKPVIMLGEPTYLSFVVHNHSDQDFQVVVGGDYRNALGRPDSFKIEVEGVGGRGVPQPNAGPGFGGLSWAEKLPANGSFTYKLFLPHWATFAETGTYSMIAKRTLSLVEGSNWRDADAVTRLPVHAHTNIEVVPLDVNKMGEVIFNLGKTMLSKGNGQASSFHLLSNIDDERVIPYFVKALETRDRDRKSRALKVLGKFDNEVAFQTLQQAMEAKGEDYGKPATEIGNKIAEDIRIAAASALAESPYYRARPFLLSKRNDTSEAVRMTILRMVGRANDEQALHLLQEMSHDESKSVSDEAKRYLRLRTQTQ